MIKVVATMCLVLTLWSAFALAFHHHSSAVGSSHCTVCVAAHSASPEVIVADSQVAFVFLATLQADAVASKKRVETFALTVRPPPAIA
jgi:hypothetical protein